MVMTIIKLSYKEEKKGEEPQLTPTPTQIPISPMISNFSYEEINDGNPEYPLQKKLPYTTDNFTIIGYDEPFTLVVRDKIGNQERVKGEVKEWIETYIPDDTKHKLVFLE